MRNILRCNVVTFGREEMNSKRFVLNHFLERRMTRGRRGEARRLFINGMLANGAALGQN